MNAGLEAVACVTGPILGAERKRVRRGSGMCGERRQAWEIELASAAA